jgi:pyrroline-5-carboxylate reductase
MKGSGHVKTNRILMIGAGRMAEAIVSGLVKQNNPTLSTIMVTNKTNENRLQELAKRYDVHTKNDWRTCIDDIDVIVLAVPPDAHDALLKELASHVNKQLIITVAAGIDPTFMEARLPQGTPVCWMMPNTSAQIQKSMTTYVYGRYVDNAHREIIHYFLEAIGDYEELTEEQVHELTAITGSAPAFLYLFSEALEEAALSYGISKKQARKLVTKMVSGSAAMLETEHTSSELREQVTTPGGSTAAGVDVLLKHRYSEIIQEAVKATNAHARRQGS